ncbi:hypothetical protein PENTCL1PPCAC_16635, partial [Pristionchus entomophagus]
FSTMDYSEWQYNVSCCKEAIIGMRIAEVSCMVVATILTVIFILAQIRTKVLHSNLRALFLATAITDFSIMYIRIYDLLHTKGLIIDTVLVLVTKYTGWTVDILLLFLILIERYYAIKHNETYDEISMKWPFRTVAIMGAILLVSGTLAVLAATGIYPRTYYIFGMLALSLFVFLSYFISLPITSKMTKRLEQRKFTINQSNYVNGRFQAHESRRSHLMLRFYIPFQVGTLLTILATATGLTLFVVPTNPTYFLLIQQCTYFLFLPRAIISMLIAVILHPSLRRTTKQISVDQEDSNASRALGTHVAVKSLSGKQLNFESDQQRDLYFKVRSNI